MCNNIWPDFHCIFKFLWQRNYTGHEVCRHRFMFASKLRISCQKYKKNSGLFLPDRMYLSSSKIPSVKVIFRRLSGDKKGLKAISYSILNWTKNWCFLIKKLQGNVLKERCNSCQINMESKSLLIVFVCFILTKQNKKTLTKNTTKTCTCNVSQICSLKNVVYIEWLKRLSTDWQICLHSSPLHWKSLEIE